MSVERFCKFNCPGGKNKSDIQQVAWFEVSFTCTQSKKLLKIIFLKNILKIYTHMRWGFFLCRAGCLRWTDMLKG